MAVEEKIMIRRTDSWLKMLIHRPRLKDNTKIRSIQYLKKKEKR